MGVYAIHVESRGYYTVEANSAEEAEEILDEDADGALDFELIEQQVVEVSEIHILRAGIPEATFDQSEVYNELQGLADSLDDHVTKQDVARELRALAAKIEEDAL